jgi:spore germination cell wall hydrolase CwlJ-like protein
VSFAILFSTPASAASWKSSVPQWITKLADSVQDRDEELDSEAKARRQQVSCLALGVYYESRGESIRGQRAVASVIMNRTRSGKFPDTPCGVILQKGQFSPFARGAVKSPSGALWTQAVGIAKSYISRSSGDIPHLYFSGAGRGLRIGNHTFR